ncbi:MAG TPA: helix-turn-helix transcriptional regulator [Longimicrobiales bacterium]|nr:helix-turn-helix transcriptional regulator [Longimicrobiales bacterium]
MTRKGLGEFEQQVLLTILRLGGESYSVPMVMEMEERGGRPVAQAAVYIALRRLEEKGLVASRMEDAADSGTGRERRYFRALPEGVALLRQSKATMDRFWAGLKDSPENA